MGAYWQKHPLKTAIIITTLIILGLAAFYLQKKGKQSAADIEQQGARKIYQNNIVVGEITGEVNIEGDYLIFKELSETGALKKNIPFEYEGVKYLIVRLENYIKEYIDEKSQKRYDILRDVTCKKLE